MIFGIPYWLFWLALCILFTVFEASTVALLSVWFALGSLAALLATFLGAGLTVQLLVFVLVSLLSLALGWRLRDKIWIARKQKTATNQDRLIGQQALVLVDIDNVRGRGQVKVGGVVWSARSVDGSPVAAGELVNVQAIEGAKLRVSKGATRN